MSDARPLRHSARSVRRTRNRWQAAHDRRFRPPERPLGSCRGFGRCWTHYGHCLEPFAGSQCRGNPLAPRLVTALRHNRSMSRFPPLSGRISRNTGLNEGTRDFQKFVGGVWMFRLKPFRRRRERIEDVRLSLIPLQPERHKKNR